MVIQLICYYLVKRVRYFPAIPRWHWCFPYHYDDVRMGAIASQITSRTSVYSTVYSDADKKKHQSSASLAFLWGIHRDRWIPRTKGQLRRKCFHLMTSRLLIYIIPWYMQVYCCALFCSSCIISIWGELSNNFTIWLRYFSWFNIPWHLISSCPYFSIVSSCLIRIGFRIEYKLQRAGPARLVVHITIYAWVSRVYHSEYTYKVKANDDRNTMNHTCSTVAMVAVVVIAPYQITRNGGCVYCCQFPARVGCPQLLCRLCRQLQPKADQ